MAIIYLVSTWGEEVYGLKGKSVDRGKEIPVGAKNFSKDVI